MIDSFRKNCRKTKNHQPRLRVVAWVLHDCSLIRQASSPASALELLIRMAGVGTAMHLTVRELALRPKVCIALISVEQRMKRRVNKATVFRA